MRVGPFVTFLLGALIGSVVTVALHQYPDHITTSETYCHICGVRLRETQTETYLGKRTTKRTLGTGLFNLLASQSEKGHRHQWVEPRAIVTPTRPSPEFTDKQDFHQAFIKKKLSDLNRLEGSAKLLGLIDSSMAYDFDRTRQSLVWRILAPKKYVDINVIYLLDRPGTWAERWAVVDQFFELYECQITSESIECTLPTKGKDGQYKRQVTFARKARSAKLGGGSKSVAASLNWREWLPPPAQPPADSPPKTESTPQPQPSDTDTTSTNVPPAPLPEPTTTPAVDAKPADDAKKTAPKPQPK